MKYIAFNALMSLGVLLAAPCAAGAVVVGAQPQDGYADTEVSTNVAFVIDFAKMSQLSFEVSLVRTPTNNVEVSIGCDANHNGNLDLGEVDYTFGYDCGKWFRRGAAEDELRVDSRAPVGLRATRTFLLHRRQMDPGWNLVKVTRRGFGSAGESVRVEGGIPGLRIIVR